MDTRTTRSNIWSDRLRAIVSGAATSAHIERWVDTSWREGEFVGVVPPQTLDQLPASGHPVARYGDSGFLRSEVCFMHRHGPGGVVVRTPPVETWSWVRTPFCVAPHVHQHPHLTVVLEGEPHFFIARSDSGHSCVLRVAVRPGHVLLCPAGIAHTFGSTGGAFTVLSIQARFVDPSQPDFARSVGTFDGLPFVLPRSDPNGE